MAIIIPRYSEHNIVSKQIVLVLVRHEFGAFVKPRYQGLPGVVPQTRLDEGESETVGMCPGCSLFLPNNEYRPNDKGGLVWYIGHAVGQSIGNGILGNKGGRLSTKEALIVLAMEHSTSTDS
jgi:hypothetical protein